MSSAQSTLRKVHVHIDAPFRGSLRGAWLRRLAQRALEREGVAGPAELSVRVTDDDTVRQLNARYRGQDEVTDVLSFALTEQGGAGPGNEGEVFVLPPDGVLHLGEVIISYPQALRQTRDQGLPVAWEVGHLLLHGVLHLLGYDHPDDEIRSAMHQKEEAVLQEIRE